MFICGSGSFAHEEEDERHSNSPCSTPKRSKKITNFCRIGKDSSNKNPYADRGLDKFYALLAELDDKKQRIYTQMGSDEISLVRFVYSNDSNQARPIVVRSKEQNQDKNGQNLVKNQGSSAGPVADPAVPTVAQDKIESAAISSHKQEMGKARFGLGNMRHPSCYLPLILVLILLFLVVYGRSFAIMCTSIGWYLIPAANGGNSRGCSTRMSKRKKGFARKLSEQKMAKSVGSSSPTSVLNGLDAVKSYRDQEIAHRRSF